MVLVDKCHNSEVITSAMSVIGKFVGLCPCQPVESSSVYVRLLYMHVKCNLVLK